MILVIDNYDSFTWNLVHLIGGLGVEATVVRNDALTAAEALRLGRDGLVLSPGPGAPKDAGICVELVRRAAEEKTPVFGVCLGLQAIAEAFGGTVGRAQRQMHGKTSRIAHDGTGLFAGLPSPFAAARYHSLAVDGGALGNSLRVSARALEDGEIMALEHAAAPIAGVQFHPESIASEHGAAIIQNFLRWAEARR
jgi:anthranilate synthase component 2